MSNTVTLNYFVMFTSKLFKKKKDLENKGLRNSWLMVVKQ